MKKHHLLLILFAITMPLQAFTARRIDLSNLPVNIRQEVLQQFPNIISENLALSELDDLVQFLARSGRFEKVGVVSTQKEGDLDSYRIEFTTNSAITDIEVTGNRNISDSEILSALQISTNEYYRPQKLEFAKERIREIYQSYGFLSPTINLTTRVNEKQATELLIEITEGRRARIKTIVFQSDNSELNSELARILKNFRDDVVTEPNLAEVRDEATEYLRQNGYYQGLVTSPEIKVNEKDEVELIYEIDKPIMFNIQIIGNKNLSTSALISHLDLSDFFSPNPSIADELKNRIEQYYLNQGYAHISVVGSIEDRKDAFTKALVFKVTEGPLVKITDFKIRGSISRPSQFYIDMIMDDSSALIKNGFFNRQQIEDALSILVIRLQNEGYLQAKVISFRSEYSENRASVDLTINLVEGPLTQVQEIELIGNNSISDRKLRELFRLKSGSPLKLNTLEEDLNDLKSYYWRQGYLEATIVNESADLVNYNHDQTLAQIRVQIKEGPQVRVAEILIEGNDLTKDYVILNELEFEKGDVLTPAMLEESLKRLQGVGFFSDVDIRMLEAQTQIADRTLLVSVAERKPGLLNFGVGVTNEQDFTIRGYAGIAYRNLNGTGRALTTRLDGKYNVTELQYPEYQLSAGYLEPYLLNSRVRGRVNLIRSEEVNNFYSATDADLYVTATNQVTFMLEQNISSSILFRWNLWQLSSLQRFYFQEDRQAETQNIASIGPSIDIDYRDHPFNPTAGSHTLFDLSYSSPTLGSSDTIEFTRISSSYTKYWNLYKSVVWANSIRGGYLKNLSDRPDGGVPFDELGFFLGGQSTIRGFDSKSERFPLATDLNSEGEVQNYLLKDESAYYLIKTELRFPLYDILSGAIFYDGGAVYISDAAADYDNSFRSSVGVGIRIGTPVGPVNFEVGFKLNADEKRGEEPLHIHFSIGTF